MSNDRTLCDRTGVEQIMPNVSARTRKPGKTKPKKEMTEARRRHTASGRQPERMERDRSWAEYSRSRRVAVVTDSHWIE